MSTEPPDLSGQKVGEYEITARIGLGGMGAVYEGRQPLIGKRVAVKVLLPQLSADRELVERFLSEARAVNEIRHRGIVDIFSFGQLPSKEHYFVMEYLQGKAFDRLIKEQAPVPFAQALAWIEETCEALQAAHETGIIHRDIKPSNIFLVDTGRGRPYVKLLDFGIAKLGASLGEATPQTRASVVIGTPDYMSPEQARGKPISPGTDIYALGCVLFELVTGRRPFKGENSLATMFMHVEEPAPKASSFNKSIMPELDDLLLWTMQKESKDRPESAEVLRQHCEQLRNMMVSSTPTGPYSSVPTPGSRQPAVRTPIPKSGQQARPATPSPRSARQQPVTQPPPSGATGWRVSQADDIGASTSISGRSKSVEQPQVTKEEQVVPLGYEATKLRPALEPEAPELAAVTAKTPSVRSKAVPTRVEQPAFNTDEAPALEVPRSKGPLFAVVGVVLVASAAGAYALLSHSSPQPAQPFTVEEIPLKPIDTRPVVEPKPDPKPVAEVKPDPKPVEEPKPVVEAKPEPKPVEKKPDPKPVQVAKVEPKPEAKPDPKPKSSGLADVVQARLARFEKKLKAKEAQTGDTYPMWHKYLERYREQAKTADTDAKRHELINAIDDSSGQL